MRREALYLTDIVAASDAVKRFCHGLTKEDFAKDELRQSAVLQKLIVIGEAVAQLSNDFTANYPDIEWRDIKAFRNFAVHAYFSVDWNIVWVTATRDVPSLQIKIARILDEDLTDD